MNFIYGLIGTPLGFVMWALYLVVHNFGIAIILFTIVARLAMFPLNLKQQKNMARSQLFMPRVQEIQTRYRNDKAKMQEELGKLQKEGYNPMGGCAPLIVTFVILFGILDVVYRPMTHIEHIDWIEKGSIAQLVQLAKETDTAEALLAETNDGRAAAYYAEHKSFAGYVDPAAEGAGTTETADAAVTAAATGAAVTAAAENPFNPVLPDKNNLTYEDVKVFGRFSQGQHDDLTGNTSPLSKAAKDRLKLLNTEYAGLQRELYAITQYSKHTAVFEQAVRDPEFAVKNPEILDKCKNLQGNMTFAGVELGERPELRLYPGIVVVVLAFVLSLAQAIITLHIQKKTMPAQMNQMATLKIMMFLSPVMSLFITFQFPLGAGLYWAVSYVVGVAQSLILYKFWHPDKLKEQARIENEKKTVKYQTVVDAVVTDKQSGESKAVRLSEMSQRQQKEYYRAKLEEARRADEEKYGSVPDSLTFGDVVGDVEVIGSIDGSGDDVTDTDAGNVIDVDVTDKRGVTRQNGE